MSRLFVFNPEHDYALSLGEGIYIAKKRIQTLAETFQLLPSLWANDDDYILTASNELVSAFDLSIIPTSNNTLREITEISPWGWDYTVRHRLLSMGVDIKLLPTLEMLKAIRTLSHRRISIALNRHMDSGCIPEEFFNTTDAKRFYRENPGCYFKAPWSSSGRGVISTATMKEKLVEEWLHGTIKHQRSVLAERKLPKKMDVATLWSCESGVTRFRGVSVSKTSNRGKYGGNLCGSQERLWDIIRKETQYFTESLLMKQKQFIDEHITPHYNGRMGIDMMIGPDGELYPAIELNLRNTMGHVAMDYFEKNETKNLSSFERIGINLLELV